MFQLICVSTISKILVVFSLTIMKLQNQVRGGFRSRKTFYQFEHGKIERKKRVQSSNQVVQFPDSFLYFRIKPRNSFTL